MELERRAARGKIDHFQILPAEAATPACSERLHPRFLGRESSCVAFIRVRLALGVGDFPRCEYTFHQTVSMRRSNGFLDPIDLAQVDARAYDHVHARMCSIVSYDIMRRRGDTDSAIVLPMKERPASVLK